MVTTDTILTQGILKPRNTRQVINMRRNVSAAQRLSKDDVYNLIQLAYIMPETIWKVELYPDLACVVGVKELMDGHNVLLETKSGTLLGYDTTFKLGDFYVSVLVFRHAMFNDSPVIPVAFPIHDRKFQKVHEVFWQFVEQIPNLDKVSIKKVTDREVDNYQAMVDYFKYSMKPGIIRQSAKFVLAALDLCDPYSGITNNISESINYVIKDMLKWREAPVDVIVLCFQLLQTYYLAEIRRGFAGVGNYTLSSNDMHCSCNLEDVIMPHVCNIDNRNCMLHLCYNFPGKGAIYKSIY